jgi:diaminohydroxyphosphoribosylaminopyrimidine deaminase/5-amino-6-(5-phosphoribosylamino)uracil reductase
LIAVYADGVTDFTPFMQRALTLAERGRGFVEPNPMVGAIVLDAAGRVVGEGYHERFGGPHAEVNALAIAGERARGGTLIVTLEPCCHFGKTPPCTEAVIQAGIRKVIVGMVDPFPKVDGGGFAAMKAAGIDVVTGVCQSDAERLNAPYLKLLGTGRPWVIQKWAMTLDGKMATHLGDSKWISSETSRRQVHELRGRMDAVIVGGNTVRIDDPLLTARPPGTRVPVRIVISASGNLPNDCQLIRTAKESPVIVATTAEGANRLTAWVNAGAELLTIVSLPALFDELGRRRMTNVLVEGGAKLHAAITDAKLADEVLAFIAPIVVGDAETIAEGIRLPGVDVVVSRSIQ